MKNEIKTWLQVETCSETKARGTFILPENFGAFNGHFPDHKILPGFVHLLIAQGALEKALGISCRLQTISQARFKSPVLPLESIAWSLEWQKKEDSWTLNSSFSGTENEKKSELRLEVRIL